MKISCVIDEYSHERLAIVVGASLRSQDVTLTLSRLMRLYGKLNREWFRSRAEEDARRMLAAVLKRALAS